MNNIKLKEIEDYVLEKVIGKGTFGVVYVGYKKEFPERKLAIKRYFQNLHPYICQMEISVLSYFSKVIADPRILKIEDGKVIDSEVYLVLPYLQSDKFVDHFKNLSLTEIKLYMYNLLFCLNLIHQHGIVHRDLKPDNFLYNFNLNKCMLIDFGLSEIDSTKLIQKINEGNVDEDFNEIMLTQKKIGLTHRIGTRGFLAPEIVFNAEIQTTAVDLWAAGVILLSFFTQRMPVFNLNKFSKITDDSIRELLPLILVFGKKKIMDNAEKFGKRKVKIDCSLHIPESLGDKPIGLKSMFNREDCPEDCFNLLEKLLELDPSKRISAAECLKHPFLSGLVIT